MDNTLKIRQKSFEELLKCGGGENEKNWEKLCSSEFPLVPFFGAGMSAWCYKTWNNLLKDIVAETYSPKCADIVAEAMECDKKPKFEDGVNEEDFHWMEEIAECIFDEDEKDYKNYVKQFALLDKNSMSEEDLILRQLRYYVGNEGRVKKSAAVGALYREFDSERMNGHGRIPEYQSYFHRLFKGLLITTNYDKALEKCYPSIFSYSYKDLEQKGAADKSWLYQAVTAKINHMKSRTGQSDFTPDEEVTVPDIPMLLKVHGSIEQASSVALSRKGYDDAYSGAMPALLEEIFKETTILFLGYSLGEDRILGVLKKAKAETDGKNKKFPSHFAFLHKDDKYNETFVNNLVEAYNVYPIFYDKDIMPLEICNGRERTVYFHDYCLGLLMENLLRRKMYYPQPLEMLWDQRRYDDLAAAELVSQSQKAVIKRRDSSYVRREEAKEIWNLLNISGECPLIAVTGEHGSGRSTLCKSLTEFQEGAMEALQFFYISLQYCRSWDEVCRQLYQSMNIVEPVIPPMADWKLAAEKVSERCGGYWRSVLVLDGIDELETQKAFPGLWNVFKAMLTYWKTHQTRVIFICHKYPADIPCYVWHVGGLKSADAKEVFFSACISGRYREISYLEDKVINKLVSRQDFRASTIEQLGIYANSKGDLTSLYEEWEYYYRLGDDGEQTVTRILWNHLLDEHKFRQQEKAAKINIIKNILWIWGILGAYPGNFPVEFFNTYFEDNNKRAGYQNPELSAKTLRFMKNIGLCVEMEEEKEVILLRNMVKCVKDFFLNPMSEKNENIKKLSKEFIAEICDETEIHGSKGLRNFRVYTMQPSQEELRKYAYKEAKENIKDSGGLVEDLKNESDLNPRKAIIKVLGFLGEKIKDNEGRMNNKKLNLVLHYEIKSVIRFLTGCILSSEDKDQPKKAILEIGYNFSHYYHYAPQHAAMLVRRFLEEFPKQGMALYKAAGMNRVMGDIQRLLGRQDDAVQYYDNALKLCNSCLVEGLQIKNNGERRKECIRIKADVLLIRSYSKNKIEEEEPSMQKAKELYSGINDRWGEAYYNQRIGELYAKQKKDGDDNDKKFFYFSKTAKYYNSAAELYAGNSDKTGNAYILKCMGDLITEFKDMWWRNDQQQYFLKKHTAQEGNGDQYAYYTIERCRAVPGDNKTEPLYGWVYDAVKCYIEAFRCYYSHINWRGFANVIQAMETCARTSGQSGTPASLKNAEHMYGLAEQCYRWLGDIRGLADTLGFCGYAYRAMYESVLEKKKKGITSDFSLDQKIYIYKSAYKWSESELIWEKLGDEEKARECRKMKAEIRQWH